MAGPGMSTTPNASASAAQSLPLHQLGTVPRRVSVAQASNSVSKAAPQHQQSSRQPSPAQSSSTGHQQKHVGPNPGQSSGLKARTFSMAWKSPEMKNSVKRFDENQHGRIPGSHLAADGEYRRAIANLEDSNKNLVHKDWKVPRISNDANNPYNDVLPCRIRLITFNDDGKPMNNAQPREFADSTDFKNFMENTPPNTPTRRLYLLEGVGPEYVATLGTHLDIDPAFFLRHQRTALWEGRHRGGNTAQLASVEDHNNSFMIEFAENLYFVEAPSSRSLRNPNDNRHINMSKMPEFTQDLDRVGIMHRKASFWSRKCPGGWNALILMDPGLTRKTVGTIDKTVILVGRSSGAKPIALETELFQGGYLDCVPYQTIGQAKNAQAPPRTCMLDDLCHYWQKHGGMVSGLSDGMKTSSILVTVCLQKIIASNYMILIGYLEANVNELETAILLYPVQEKRKHQTMQVTEQWAILQSWSHRFPEYNGMIDDILDWHFKAASGCDAKVIEEWEKCTNDFKAIKRRLDILRDRTQLLSDSFVGLASMAGIQESLDEAKAVKLLTVLGFFFVPLSLVSSLFAMPNKDTLINVPSTGVLSGFRYYALIAFTVSGGMTFFVVCYIWGLNVLLRSVANAAKLKK
ncbi:unnamed protein product [Periconia digitata]|uniref:Uncharacterized protein n=1 Tax=Periconia digitata TaxID=1303443 RepID=A0A9W4XU32_9PLEO|nr:unnamed protein product [Periconia digitata]